MAEQLLTPAEVAGFLRVSERTLDQWRYFKRGPRWVKIGRHVRYRGTDVEAWVEEQATEAGAAQ